jgi:hypothetical protein
MNYSLRVETGPSIAFQEQLATVHSEQSDALSSDRIRFPVSKLLSRAWGGTVEPIYPEVIKSPLTRSLDDIKHA